MFSFSELNELQVIAFGLILLRMLAFCFSSAIFNSPSVPVAFRILFSIVFTVVLFPIVVTAEQYLELQKNVDKIIYLSAVEIIVGLCLGFVTRLFFFTVAMAGELIALSIGIGQAQIFNPLMGSLSNPLEQFVVFLATILYLMLNGHHFLIQGLVDSFTYVSILKTELNAAAFSQFVFGVQKFFVIGIQISAPVLISMLVVQVGTGLVSRAVPQINFLATSVAISIGIGFVILLVSLPYFVHTLGLTMQVGVSDFFGFIKRI